MATRIGWGNQGKDYLYYQFSGSWTWTEHIATIQKVRSFQKETGNQQIPIVINLADTGLIPPASFRYLTHVLLNQYPAQSIIIFTGMSRMIHALLKTLTQLYPAETKHLRLARDLHHASYILKYEGYIEKID
ncbi:MAG: hypothetical protein ACPG7F_14565 [Aggregatilineales bacterium]